MHNLLICTLRCLITIHNQLSIYSLFPQVTHTLQTCQMDFLYYFKPQRYLRSAWMAYFFYIISILYAQRILYHYSLHYCLFHYYPTVHLPSILTPFYMDNLLSALSSFCVHNLLYALSTCYMDSLYFTFTLRINAVLYKHPTLHISSALSPWYMISLMVQYQIEFKIKSSTAIS